MKKPSKLQKSAIEPPLTSRNKLRVEFFEKEKNDAESYIADLEATIAINKSVIQDLCNGSVNDNSKYKLTISKLNEEHIILTRQNKKMKIERDAFASKNLILEQLVEELKCKESEQAKEWKETYNEMIEQLNLKEYILQVYQKRCNDAEVLIIKYLHNVPEAKKTLKELQTEIKEKTGISNLVTQNDQLKNKVRDMNNEIMRLKRDLNTSELVKITNVLKEKINGLVNENEEDKQKLAKQVKMNQDLYDLNEKMSVQLRNLNKQVCVLIHSQRMNHADTLHSQRSNEGAQQVFYTQEAPTQKGQMVFSELSSIEGEDDDQEGKQNEKDENKQGKTVLQ